MKKTDIAFIGVLVIGLLSAGAVSSLAQCSQAGGGACGTAGCPIFGGPAHECTVSTCAVSGGPAGCTGTLSVTITDANCNGTTCPAPPPRCGTPSTLGGSASVTFTKSAGPACTSPRQIIVCHQWVDCSGAGTACSGCTTATITLDAFGNGTWASGAMFGCSSVTAGNDYQLTVNAIDVTGNTCHTCSSGCTPSASCNNCTGTPASAKSCCIPI